MFFLVDDNYNLTTIPFYKNITFEKDDFYNLLEKIILSEDVEDKYCDKF